MTFLYRNIQESYFILSINTILKVCIYYFEVTPEFPSYSSIGLSQKSSTDFFRVIAMIVEFRVLTDIKN